MLEHIELEGFKSIKKMSLDLRPINILIGANGSGKSNFISFFKFLNQLAAERMQLFVGVSGGASSILHLGAKSTQFINAALSIATVPTELEYSITLAHAAPDSFIVAKENWRSGALEVSTSADVSATFGYAEADLNHASALFPPAKFVLDYLKQCRVYQFHDTGDKAGIRMFSDTSNNRSLMTDGANLASVLLKLKTLKPEYYSRIVKTIRLVAPFFDDFILESAYAESHSVNLRWRQKDSEYEFGPHQLSDGTLRAMALITLLLQPEEDLPKLIVLDEPELGLHPYAMNLLAGLLKSVSEKCQIVAATQSSTFVDQFQPEDIVVAERVGSASTFTRLDLNALKDWLQEYSLGELWEKNVIGGRPARD